MNDNLWPMEKRYLEERAVYLKKLAEKFGPEVIDVASRSRIDMYAPGIAERGRANPDPKPRDPFMYCAYRDGTSSPDFLDLEILEDTDDAFELRVTRCKYAEVYRAMGAPEVGFAMHCSMDEPMMKAYDSDLVFSRDKTLMEGHDCCNHRYAKRPR